MVGYKFSFSGAVDRYWRRRVAVARDGLARPEELTGGQTKGSPPAWGELAANEFMERANVSVSTQIVTTQRQCRHGFVKNAWQPRGILVRFAG